MIEMKAEYAGDGVSCAKGGDAPERTICRFYSGTGTFSDFFAIFVGNRNPAWNSK